MGKLVLVMGICLGLQMATVPEKAIALADYTLTQNYQPNHNLSQKSNNSCSGDLSVIIPQFLKDLPSYTNRVTQRARKLKREADIFSYLIVAGRPEFEPLPLSSNQYSPEFPDSVEQIFFTTLERQYLPQETITRQNYHWLFLSQTDSGWRMIFLFTRLGTNQESGLISPPRESSDSALGQAIDLWLRDCRAGSV